MISLGIGISALSSTIRRKMPRYPRLETRETIKLTSGSRISIKTKIAMLFT
jgi:hypothetical protein